MTLSLKQLKLLREYETEENKHYETLEDFERKNNKKKSNDDEVYIRGE